MPPDSPVRHQYPLHWAVYTNDLDDLKNLLNDEEVEVDKVDVRGRTPLMLAVVLGHKTCVDVLLEKGADADAQNKEMWSLSHEAVTSGDPELIRTIIKYRDYQRSVKYRDSMMNTLQKLKDTPDFYAEMSWEFSSWVPFVSRMCPSDTYKIYKSGSFVRIDTTLVGFEGSSWRRGNQTFIFRLTGDENSPPNPQVIVIDHDARTASVQSLPNDERLEDFDPPAEAIEFRMTNPVSTTYIDVDKIGFERSKAGGLLSWISSSERNENVDGYDCKVFNASNVDLVTKQRMEHLTEEDKARFKEQESSSPLASVLNMVRSETAEPTTSTADSLGGITATEYLDKEFPMQCDIGRPKQISRKSNSFKATLWLAEDYPLNLQEQIIPIVDLMASNSAHFARLNNFIRLQLPAGFPAKIEIPLFHVVSARITFGRINEPGPYVTPVDGSPLSSAATPVTIDERVFDIPTGYRVFDDRMAYAWFDGGSEAAAASAGARGGAAAGGQAAHFYTAEQQEEMLLQLAIQQSLLEASGAEGGGSEVQDVALAAYGNGVPRAMIHPMLDQEARDLALAIQASLQLDQNQDAAAGQAAVAVAPPVIPDEDELTRVLRLSQAEDERRRRDEELEDEELRRILELSKLEM